MPTMRAARLMARRCMGFDEAAPRPEPAEGEVLARTLVASICGSDFHVIDHGYLGRGRPDSIPGPPGFPGHESVVEVVEAPADTLPVGTLALAVPPANRSAAYAEYQALPPSSLVPLPPRSPWSEAVLAQQFGTVVFALANFWPGALDGVAVAIVGAGPAGLMFTHEARRRGAGTIVVSDPSAVRREAARLAGADEVVVADAEALESAVRGVTDGAGATLVIEASGEDTGRLAAVRGLARDGTVGLFGLPQRTAPAPFDVAGLFERRGRVVATHSTQLEPGLTTFRAALQRLADGELHYLGLLTHRFPLEAIDAAFDAARRRDDALKVALDVATPGAAGGQ